MALISNRRLVDCLDQGFLLYIVKNSRLTSDEGWWIVQTIVLPLAAISFIIRTSFLAL